MALEAVAAAAAAPDAPGQSAKSHKAAAAEAGECDCQSRDQPNSLSLAHYIFTQGLHDYSTMPNIGLWNYGRPWNYGRRLICATILRRDLAEYSDFSE